jgi:hypothetical protein
MKYPIKNRESVIIGTKNRINQLEDPKTGKESMKSPEIVTGYSFYENIRV